MFGTNPEIIKYLDDVGRVLTELNKKITFISSNAQQTATQLARTNDLLEEIKDEIKSKGKFQISNEFAFKTIQNEQLKNKKKVDLYPTMYLDEILEEKLLSIKNDIAELMSSVEVIKNVKSSE